LHTVLLWRRIHRRNPKNKLPDRRNCRLRRFFRNADGFDSGLQLNDVLNFVVPFARRSKAGEDHRDHAFPEENRVTDFELRFVGAPYDGISLPSPLHCQTMTERQATNASA
jgi:hypothetical protein